MEQVQSLVTCLEPLHGPFLHLMHQSRLQFTVLIALDLLGQERLQPEAFVLNISLVFRILSQLPRSIAGVL